MLGKLAKWLRILGFDTRCELLDSQDQVAAYREEGYILVSRREKWRDKANVLCLKTNDSLEQLREVVARTVITRQEVRLLRRCVRCNQQLGQIERDEAFGTVPDYIFETHTIFRRCRQCRKIFWAGSHAQRVRQRLEEHLGWHLTEPGTTELP